MNRILAFAGTKQAGKNTCCNFLHGYQLRSYHIIDHFAITESGELAVDTKVVDAEGNEQQNLGVLDVTRIDADFMEWAIYNMWPFVKHYAFATALKEISMGLFGLTKDQCYGTDQDKNTFTTWRWENMPGVGKKKGRMKAREFLQYFGSDICREINENVWTDTTIEQIEKESPLIGIIKYSDGTFQENELVGFKPNSEYEFIIDNERLYRVLNNFITIKYEYQGNEKEYNQSWA